LTWRYHWSVFSICPGFSPPDTYPWPWDITGQFFLSVLDFLPQTHTPGLEISLVSSLFLSWIFSPRYLPLVWGYHWSVLYICPGFSTPDTYPWPEDITGQFFITVLDFLPQTPTPGLGISLVSSFYLSWIFSPRHLLLAWGYHWSVLSICPGFSPPDTYPWPGDITGQFFISVLDFLPQTPTPGLGISLVSSLYLSWIFSPRHLPLAWGYHWSVLYICPGFSPPDTYSWPGDITE
jgi:hypothetical protein